MILGIVAVLISSAVQSFDFALEEAVGEGSEICSSPLSPQLVVHWEQAIASYDPIRDALWLEFDIRWKADDVISCSISAREFEAHVELDGVVVAIWHEQEEAGLEITPVGLGRHWMSVTVRLSHSTTDAAPVSSVEFVLPFHTHLEILQPRSRVPIPLRELQKADGDVVVCVRVVCGANASAGPCVPPGSAITFAIDGAAFARPISLPDDDPTAAPPLCVPLPPHPPRADGEFPVGRSATAEWEAGRYQLATWLTDAAGAPLGPISYTHHLIVAGPLPAPSSPAPPERGARAAVAPRAVSDAEIALGGWAPAGGGHGPSVAPRLDAPRETRDGRVLVSSRETRD